MEPLSVGVEKAAEVLGLSRWTIRKYVREGRLASSKVGSRVLIEVAELRRLLEECRKGA